MDVKLVQCAGCDQVYVAVGVVDEFCGFSETAFSGYFAYSCWEPVQAVLDVLAGVRDQIVVENVNCAMAFRFLLEW